MRCSGEAQVKRTNSFKDASTQYSPADVGDMKSPKEEYIALERSQKLEIEAHKTWLNCWDPGRLNQLQTKHEEERAHWHAEQISRATELATSTAQAHVRLQAAEQRLAQAEQHRDSKLAEAMQAQEVTKEGSLRQGLYVYMDTARSFVEANLQQIRVGYALSMVGGAAFIVWRARLLHGYRSIADIPPELFGWHSLPLQGRVVAVTDNCTLLVQHVPRLRRLLPFPISTPTSASAGLLELRLFGIRLDEELHGPVIGQPTTSPNNSDPMENRHHNGGQAVGISRPESLDDSSERVLFKYRAEQWLQVVANENRVVDFTLLTRSHNEDDEVGEESDMLASTIIGYRQWPSPFVKDLAVDLITAGIAEICDKDIIDSPAIEGGEEKTRNENARQLAAHIEKLGTAQEVAQKKELGRWDGWAEKERQWRVSTGDQQPPLRRALDWVGGVAAWRKRHLEEQERDSAQKGSPTE
jgi:endonuclease YncB( thermonuclease family)